LAVAYRVPAQAATEFCPAELTGPYTRSSERDVAVQYYNLRALGPREIEGTIVAETDAGWFIWKQQPVRLTRITYTSTTWSVRTKMVRAQSPEMSVVFPTVVNVRRAWVAFATTHGDATFNWDARGKVACDPPDFAALDSPGVAPSRQTPQRDDPTPAPAPAPATAVKIAEPLPMKSCSHPFLPAGVRDAVQPVMPAMLGGGEVVFRPTVSLIEVAIDSNGKLVDAWVFAQSGYPKLDEAALTAARKTTYAPAISYCRPVNGTYLYRSDFTK
jgi:hypothetical protein